MEPIISRSESITVGHELISSTKVKKKGKRNIKKNKKRNEDFIHSSDLTEADGLYLPGLHFISKPERRILYKTIADGFNQWLGWQRKIALCGLTGKCSKSLVRTMGTVVEPVLHGSFRGATNLPFYVKRKVDSPDSKLDSLTSAIKSHSLMQDGKLSTAELQNGDHDTCKDMMVAIACHDTDQIPKNRDICHQAPSLPPIEPRKNSLIASDVRSFIEMGHKHCNKDELKSTASHQFFPDIMLTRSTGLGKICAAKTVINLEMLSKKYTSKVFKNRKFWSMSAQNSTFVTPNGKRLLENFNGQLETTYKWFTEWSDAEQGGCILEILSVCKIDEIEYFSQCILQRLKDRSDINRLPDNVLLNIFQRLTAEELLSAGLVCRRWKSLADNQTLWKDNCHSLGLQKGIPDIIEKIETAAGRSSIDWKISYRDLVLKICERDARLEELKRLDMEQKCLAKGNEDAEIMSSDGNDDDLSSPAYTDELDDKDGDSDEEIAVELMRNDAEDEVSVVSGMTDFLNGDLGMIEDSVQQLSAQAKRLESRQVEEDTVLDIRPEWSTQAKNELASTLDYENLFKFVDVDGVKILKRVRKLQGHLDAVLALQFDNKRVITGSADRTARLWDVRSGRCIHKLKGHKGGVRSICFDTEYIVTGSWDTTIIVWSAVKFKRIKILDAHKDCVSCLDMNGEILVSGSHDRTIKIWSRGSWTCENILTGHQGCIMSLCIVDKSKVLTGGMDRTAKLWNIADGSCLRSYLGSLDVILTVKSYGDLVAAGTQDGSLLFWDINTSHCEGMITAHTGPLHSISFYGARFVTVGGDQLLKEWDLSTCSCLRSFTGHKDAVLCVQASSRRIVSGSADGTLRIWDMSSRLR